ncbi:hypothetical protein JS562_35745, partial [Agrobacterium sp. S2]|nr:hypothetical protein [Agrobacterium sp. S2]
DVAPDGTSCVFRALPVNGNLLKDGCVLRVHHRGRQQNYGSRSQSQMAQKHPMQIFQDMPRKHRDRIDIPRVAAPQLS